MTQDTKTEDAEVFGEDVFVHCNSHGRPHMTGWCTVGVDQKTLLKATNHADAIKECQERGLWLYDYPAK